MRQRGEWIDHDQAESVVASSIVIVNVPLRYLADSHISMLACQDLLRLSRLYFVGTDPASDLLSRFFSRTGKVLKRPSILVIILTTGWIHLTLHGPCLRVGWRKTFFLQIADSQGLYIYILVPVVTVMIYDYIIFGMMLCYGNIYKRKYFWLGPETVSGPGRPR